MTYKTISVDVEVNLDDFSDDELIEAVESMGYLVVEKEDSGAMSESVKDEIFSFYKDYILWKDFGMKNETFERIAGKFFQDHLGIIVD